MLTTYFMGRVLRTEPIVQKKQDSKPMVKVYVDVSGEGHVFDFSIHIDHKDFEKCKPDNIIYGSCKGYPRAYEKDGKTTWFIGYSADHLSLSSKSKEVSKPNDDQEELPF